MIILEVPQARQKDLFDMKATRRQAREWAVQMLTAVDLNPPENLTAFIINFWEMMDTVDEKESGAPGVSSKLKSFAEERVVGVVEHENEIDEILKTLLDHWDLYRLGTVERAVLRLGIWEMKYSDVPGPVVINEAVDLANWFSAPSTRKIINGVLDKFGKSLAAAK